VGHTGLPPGSPTGAPFETAASGPSLDDRPPEVGKHMREVLFEHDYSAEEIRRLVDEDVVVTERDD